MYYSVYIHILLFFIYSFLGWCCEVVYHTIEDGKFYNRGFLNAPICPIYGFGALSVLFIFEPVKHHYFILFFGSGLLATVLELITGILMEKIFKTRWWDYTDKKYNFMGYICLPFSIIWGLLCFFVVSILNPAILKLISFIPIKLGVCVVCVFIVLFIIDIIDTLDSVSKFNHNLETLDKISRAMTTASVGIGTRLTSTTFKTLENLDEKRLNYLKLKEEYEQTLKSVKTRFLKAFPDIKSLYYKDALEKVKQYISEKDKS